MAGGDGSQALVASVAAAHGAAYVCVPAGTRNHLAMDLGLDRDDVVGALEAFGPAVERPVDLARVGDRVFVNNASLGVYAEAVQRPGYREAKRATIAETLPELLGPKAEPLDLRFVGPDGEAQRGAHVILVSNNPYNLARLDGLGSRVRLDSGRLGVVVVNVPARPRRPSCSRSMPRARCAGTRAGRSGMPRRSPSTPAPRSPSGSTARRSRSTLRSSSPSCPARCVCACPWMRPTSRPPRWPWLRSARRHAWCARPSGWGRLASAPALTLAP